MRTLWINTETMEHVFSDHAWDTTGNVPVWITCNHVLTVGYRATYTWNTATGYVGHDASIVYALPAPASDEDPQPLRMAQRNDGYGTSERHPRMNNSTGSASSNPDNSTRVFGGGESSYR